MAEDTGPKEPLGGKRISDLVELMEANNKSTSKIEVDGRNTRRHLLEMKNMQRVMNDFQARTVYGFENFQEMLDSQKLQDAENKMENRTIFQEIRDALKAMPGDTGKAVEKESAMGGFGKMLGAGAGVGLAGAGIGLGIAAVFATAPKLINMFETMDVDKIESNVLQLVGINEAVEEKGGNLLLDGGSLAIALGAIGTGLAIFAVGGSAAEAANRFQSDDWIQTIKNNVLELLSIESAVEAQGQSLLGGSSKLAVALTALGVGLAAFGIGKAAGGVGEAISEFTSGENFAEDIKDEVETLLSIDLIPKTDPEQAGFVGTMSTLALGLSAFAVGKTFSSVGDMLTKFPAGDNFAQDIKDEVETLLSIDLGSAQDTGKFILTMGGLSAGLVAFAYGKAGSGVADAFTRFTQGDNFAEDVKKEVETLLTIGQGADASAAENAASALTSLAGGLATFAGAQGLGALSSLADSVISFFTGGKNPVDQALLLGENATKVQAGADAFDDFAEALGKFSNIRFEFDAEEFTEQALDAAKTLEAIMTGGKIPNTGIFFNEKMESGLSGLIPEMDAFSGSMERLNNSMGANIALASAENDALRVSAGQGGASGGGSAAFVDQSNKRGGDTILIQQSNTDIVSESLRMER